MIKIIKEDLKLVDRNKNFIRVINPNNGKVLFEKENLVTQRGRLFTLEKIFNDFYTNTDNAGSEFNIKYYDVTDGTTTPTRDDAFTAGTDIFVLVGGNYYLLDTDPQYVPFTGDRSTLTSEDIYFLVEETYTLLDGGTDPTRTEAIAESPYVTDIFFRVPTIAEMDAETDDPYPTTCYTFIENTDFNNREIVLFKVGVGGTTGNHMEPYAPSPTDSDLGETVKMRKIDTGIDTNDYSETYCIKSNHTLDNSNVVDIFEGKYFDNKDPEWVIDTVRNIIAKKITMTLNVNDLRDIIVNNASISHRSGVERQGVVTAIADRAICKATVAEPNIDITGLSIGDHISFDAGEGDGTETFQLSSEFVVGTSTTYIFLEKLGGGDDFNFANYTTAGDIVLYPGDDLLGTTIGTVNIVQNMDISDLNENDDISVDNTMYTGGTYDGVYAVKTATGDLASDTFKIKPSDTTSDVIETSNHFVLIFKGGVIVGSANIQISYEYFSTFNELGLYFAELDSNDKVIDGTEELFSRVTFATHNLEDSEEILIHYYVYA